MEKEEFFGKIGEYNLISPLGSGQYSSVYLATKNNNEYFACKFTQILNISKVDDDYKTKMFEIESKILSEVKDENICVLVKGADIGYLITEADQKPQKVIYMILEYLPSKDLSYFINGNGKENFPEKTAKFIFTKIIKGIEFLHAKGFTHRDIKLNNIMLDKNYNPKLIDFGFGAPIIGSENNGLHSSFKGTLLYEAPEIISEEHYEAKPVDIFAAGVTLFVMTMGFFPFESTANVGHSQEYEYIAMKNEVELWKYYQKKHTNIKQVSKDFLNLIFSMLDADPKNRIKIEDILKHDWMIGEMPKEDEIFKEFKQRNFNIEKEKEEICEKSKAALNKNKGSEEQIFSLYPNLGNSLSGGKLTEIKNKVIRKYDRPYGFLTAQELHFDDQFILNSICTYANSRGCQVQPNEKYMSVQIGFINKYGEFVKLNAEVMRDKKMNVLVIDKLAGDKFNFLLFYHAIIGYLIGDDSKSNSI